MAGTVSVIIPCYNQAHFLSGAIESVLAQTLQPREIIVVDDGSPDGVEAAVAPYRGKIRYLSQENRGLSAARNYGIREARGSIIAFLDADDLWLPHKLEEQLRLLEGQPSVGLVHSDLIYWDTKTGEKTQKRCGRHEKTGRCYPGFVLRNGVTPSTMLVRRECLERVGDFDEQIRRPTTQDYDLCFRIAKHYELRYVDEPLVLYRQHSGSASLSSIAMLEDELFVVTKALQSDPDLSGVVGEPAVRDRLFSLLFDIGYCYHDSFNRAEARKYFSQALSHRRLDVYVWFLILVNFLPASTLRGLRRLKSQVREKF